MKKQRNGFTLVELSIVLVILGLLVGGVLTGQSLIRAAELRSVSTEQTRFVTALNTFRDKYFALPGDMPNASAYWGLQAAAGSGTCKSTPATTTATCDGDGNGQIAYDNTTATPSYEYESFRAWQHLANAGLIEGTYTGVGYDAGYLYYRRGVDVPTARVGNSGVWALWYLTSRFSGGGTWMAPRSGHYLALGNIAGATVNRWHNPLLKAQDAYNLDMKMDDGKPNTGTVSVMATATYNANCATDQTDGANYLLSSTVVGCIMFFSTGF